MRKFKHSFILLLIAIMYLPFNALAQEWSLEKCIEHAIENNIQIKQQTLQVSSHRSGVKQSKAALLPSVNASATHGYNFGRSVDPFTNDFSNTKVRSNNFGVGASIDLFRGGQNYHVLQKSNIELMASLQDLERIKNNISLNIATAYLQILFNKENLANAERQLNVTQLQVDRTIKLVNAGSLPKGDLLEIQAQKATEELAVINADNNLRMSYLTLTQFLELKNEDIKNFSIETPVISGIENEEVVLTVDMIYLEAQQLPQIKSAEYRVKSAYESLAIAKGGRTPTLSMNLSWGTGYSDARKLYTGEIDTENVVPIGFIGDATEQIVNTYDYITHEHDYEFGDQLKDNVSTSLTFRLSIPIFNNFQVQSNVIYKKLDYQNTEYSLELTKNELYKDIQQAYNNTKTALAEYKGSLKALEARKEAFKYMQQKFDVGMITTIEYNTSKIQLNEAETDLLRAKYNYIFTQKILDFYRGKELTLK